MFGFFQPRWLYESLPYLYIAAGAAALVLVGPPVSLICGGALIVAGSYIGVIRQLHRRRRRAERAARRARRETEYTDWGSAL